MPTYDYRCKFCDHQFEHFQGLSDKKLRKCPECSRQGLERLIGSGAGIVFKGSGFYETDYRSSSYKDGAKLDRPAAADSGKAADPSGDKGGDQAGDKGGSKADPKPASGSGSGPGAKDGAGTTPKAGGKTADKGKSGS